MPLVLIEALACACRSVSSDLPGIRSQLAPVLGEALEMVPLPRLRRVDQPRPEDLPGFVADLASALSRALDKPPLPAAACEPAGALRPFTWAEVFRRTEAVWKMLLDGTMKTV